MIVNVHHISMQNEKVFFKITLKSTQILKDLLKYGFNQHININDPRLDQKD
jgi:hypothetical protein